MLAEYLRAWLNLLLTHCSGSLAKTRANPRDRSLITVSALIASGQSAQIGYHLNRAMDNGLSAEEAGEIVTQAAFYAGWPNAFTAAPVVGEVLINRSSSKT